MITLIGLTCHPASAMSVQTAFALSTTMLVM